MSGLWYCVSRRIVPSSSGYRSERRIYNGEVLCSLWGRDWVNKSNWDYIQSLILKVLWPTKLIKVYCDFPQSWDKFRIGNQILRCNECFSCRCPRINLQISPTSSHSGRIKPLSKSCSLNTKFSPNAQHLSAAHFNIPRLNSLLSSHANPLPCLQLILTNTDERVEPGKLQSSILSIFPVIIRVVTLLTPLRVSCYSSSVLISQKRHAVLALHVSKLLMCV